MPRRFAGGRLAAILFITVFAVTGLSACGDSGGSEASRSSTSTSTDESTSGSGEHESQQADHPPKKHRVTAEQEVGNFGGEADTGSRQAVLAAEHAYLTSLAAKRFDVACAHLSKSVEQSLGQVAEPKLRAKGCVAILPMAMAGSSGGAVKEQLEGNVTKVRIHGREALVLYRTTVGLFAFPMIHEAGAWKAASLAGSIVAPSQQALNK